MIELATPKTQASPCFLSARQEKSAVKRMVVADSAAKAGFGEAVDEEGCQMGGAGLEVVVRGAVQWASEYGSDGGLRFSFLW